ncbi:MAG: capsule assembly Wzi family protein [Bacteroidia bacterium]
MRFQKVLSLLIPYLFKHNQLFSTNNLLTINFKSNTTFFINLFSLISNIAKVFCLLSFIFNPLRTKAQQLELPLNNQINEKFEKYFQHPENNVQTSFKPLISSFAQYDSLKSEEYTYQKHFVRKSLLGRKIKQESLIEVKKDDFYLSIDPLFNFTLMNDMADTSLRADTTNFYINTRGLLVQGNIGEKFSFESSFYENQAFFPEYLHQQVRTYRMVPGQGRVKDFKKGGFDYAMASGYFSYTPYNSEKFKWNIRAGHGKNFVGEGYRSLLLSDNAFNYPYVKSTIQYGIFQYVNTFAVLQSLERTRVSTITENLFYRKKASFHYLGFNPHKRLHIGFFEGIIWQMQDTNSVKPFEPSFALPVIFANTLRYGLNDEHNAIIGTNLKFKLHKKITLYGQLVSDDFARSRFAYQAGIKSFELIKNLFLQAEYNNVKAFTYSHAIPLQSYTHYNQSLTHPLGANFDEILFRTGYSFKDLFIQYRYSFAHIDKDNRGGNFGNDIFKSNYSASQNDFFLRPITSTLTIQELRAGYIINRKTNMQIAGGVFIRTENATPIAPIHNSFIYTISISTNLANFYYDF